MAGNSRKVDVEVSISGEQKYKQAISELNAANKTLGAEMKKLAEEYKGNEESMDYLTKKGESLQDMLAHQREKVQQLQEAVKLSAQLHGEASTKTQSYAQQLSAAETSVLQLERAIEENNRAMEQQAYSTKEFDDNLKVLESQLRGINAQMAAEGETVDNLREKNDILNDILAEQESKYQTLVQALEDAVRSGTASEQELNQLQIEVNDAAAAYFNTSAAIEKNNAVMQENLAELGREQKGFVSLGDALDGLSRKFGVQIPDAAKNALNGMGSFSAGSVAALGAAAAGVAAVIEGTKKLYEMTVEYAAKADELISRSQQTGLSTDFLQAYEYAQNLVDVDLETFISGMRKMTDQMDAARDGNAAMQESFAALGVEITNVADGSLRPADEVMLEVIDALHDMENETERNALASEIFGKSYQSLNPLIVQGTDNLKSYMEAAKENYNLTNDEIKALGGLDDAVQMNKNEWEGLRQHLAAQFAPAATETLESFTKLIGNAGKALEDSKIVEGVGEIFRFLVAMFEPLTELLDTADSAEGRLRPVYEVLNGIAGALAWMADALQVIVGISQVITGIGGRMNGLNRIGNALGYGGADGEYSNMQKWNGTANVLEAQRTGYVEYGGNDMSGYGYDPNTGLYYDKETGNYYFGNASGNDNWRGGLTWVGENGPELVSLPRGSQIMNAQESREAGGNVYIETVVIDASNIQELNDIVRIFLDARVDERMR